ncbi:MAG: YkgJ family cysteine cluster protein [Acidobacteriota bacterium]
MENTSASDPAPANYDCTKCPAYCCSIYERVQVTKRDINRLAKHFGISYETAFVRYTRPYNNERVLRRKADPIFGQACRFLNPATRQCGIYHARPGVCREYPETERCAYFDLIEFERSQQGDPDVVPLVKITFRDSRSQ